MNISFDVRKVYPISGDHAFKDFFFHPHYFADLCNGILFDGNQVIDSNELRQWDSQETLIIDEKEGIQRNRDLIKQGRIDKTEVILTIEHQGKKIRVW